VEARGRVIDSLGVLLLRLAEDPPAADIEDDMKQVAHAIGSFETAPKAFPRAEHHIVESFQLWVSQCCPPFWPQSTVH
jgi:hypothetical protein